MERIIIPLITPFDDGYGIDYECMYRHVDRLYRLGIRGFFTPSTTGEIDKISFGEVTEIIDNVFGRLNGEYELYIGLRGEDPRELLNRFKVLDGSYEFDGYVIPPPSYSKYGQEELKNFYIYLAGGTDKPIIIYNIPSLTGNLIGPKTYIDILREVDNILATKVTYNDSKYLVELLKSLNVEGFDLKVYVGSDPLILTNLSLGGYGVIPGIGNIYPEYYLGLIDAYLRGDFRQVINIYNRIIEVYVSITRDGVFQKNIKAMLGDLLPCIKPIMRPPYM